MKLLLATLHAKYVHASLALPCLAAVCRELPAVATVIREYTINEPPEKVLRRIVAEEADVVAFSCYLWNVEATLRLAADLKKVRPETFVVLGGPEVSFGFFELLERYPAVDAVVRGEGEETFRELVAALARAGGGPDRVAALEGVAGLALRCGEEIVATSSRPHLRDLDLIPSPFAAGLVDLAKPLVYVETSRGCPFACAFCLSSLEPGVRTFSLERVRFDLTMLLEAGVQTVKFVDRTFNADSRRAQAIWEFILDHNRGSSFHFEIAADLLTDENLELLRRVPAETFRFEIGVQTADAATLAAVERRSDLARLFANVRRLQQETGVVLHLDLVAGLPGEDFPGFLNSLQRLLDVAPHHIQVEPVKVLKGSPMRRIAAEQEYAFSDLPPYPVLQTPWLSFTELSRIGTIARLLDILYNCGRFATALAALGESHPLAKAFDRLAAFWEEGEVPEHLSLPKLFGEFWRFGESVLVGEGRERFREALCFDWCRADFPGSGPLPPFWREEDRLAWQRDEVASQVRTLQLPAGSRVRTFVARFGRDYRRQPWGAGPVELLFVYVATPGLGLTVHVLPFTP